MSIYDVVILVALFGFIALAFVLLAPVYLFLKREEKISEGWTPETLAARTRDAAGENGAHDSEDKPEE